MNFFQLEIFFQYRILIVKSLDSDPVPELDPDQHLTKMLDPDPRC
jgi:hypothetical protein